MTTLTKRVLGPIIVTEDQKSLKLFSICRSAFSSISKKELRELFTSGHVLLNDVPLLPSNHGNPTEFHNIECKRVQVGDKVEIILDRKAKIEKLEKFAALIVEYCDEHLGIVEKPPGVCSDWDSEFDIMCRLKLWDGKYFDTVSAMYFLDKAVSGIMIYCKGTASIDTCFRKLFLERSLTLQLMCVVSGRITDDYIVVGASSLLPTVLSLKPQVIQTARCRSKSWISLVSIEIEYRVEERSIEDNMKLLTKDMKNIKVELKRRGYSVVGHDNHVVAGKGLYLQWNCLRRLNDDSINISLNIPPKFFKLLEKEDQFYRMANKNEPAQSELVNPEADEDIPMEYINSKALFCGLEFFVNSKVMIPRHSSEVLVHTAIKYLQDKATSCSVGQKGKMQVLDLGTGSGVLLLSILKKLKDLDVDANVCGRGVDISEAAILIAVMNAANLGLCDICKFSSGDFIEIKSWFVDVQFDSIDLIICNPPYSAVNESNRLSDKAKKFEPPIALYADRKDQLKAYKTICKTLQDNSAHSFAKKSPFSDSCILIFEVGHKQAKQVRHIMEISAPWWEFKECAVDAKGIERCLVFQRSCNRVDVLAT